MKRRLTVLAKTNGNLPKKPTLNDFYRKIFKLLLFLNIRADVMRGGETARGTLQAFARADETFEVRSSH
jgi:hypothetical protein